MRSTSEEYRIDTDKDFRNRSYCEIELDLLDAVETNVDIESVRNQLDYSTTELINHTPRQAISYATLEQDRIKLDGSTSVYFTTSLPFPSGFISENISDSNGEFENGTQPMLDITFEEPVTLNGITIWSDLHTNDRISDFDIITINSSEEEERMSVNGNESVACSVNHNFTDITSIRIIVNKTNKPNMRARIGYIDFGIVKIYDNETLLDNGVRFIEKIDPLSRELSMQSVEFTVDNYNHEYDIDNPNGIYEKISNNLPVIARIGYELDTGSIEWLDMGIFYLSEWNIETYKARFKAVSYLNSLNDNYYSSFSTSNNTIPTFTLDQLISDVLGGETTVRYESEIYQRVLNVSIRALLDIMPRNQVLQYIANLLGVVVTTYPQLNAILFKNPSYNQAYELNKEKYMEDTLKVELEENLKAVEVKYYNYSVDDTEQEIFNGTIKKLSNNDKVKYVYFDRAYAKVTYTATVLSGDVSITYDDVSSTRIRLILDGAGEIRIVAKGYEINRTENIYTLNVNTTGEVATFENPLVTNQELAKDMAYNIRDYLTKKSKYSMDYRGEAMLQPTDNIKFENQFSSGLNLLVTKNEINFNGGITGKIEGKVV